jgi:Uma2 family endonuclease
MRAVLIDPTDRVIEERRRLGIDKQDERWAGEWHLVNPPKHWHVRLNTELLIVLAPLAQSQGLVPYGDATGLFAADDDWRVPDQAYARPDDHSEAGLTSAELVVEIRSPGDDAYLKLPFYALRGVQEVLVIHEDRQVELFRRRDDGEMTRVETESGAARSAVLDVTFTTAPGPTLRVEWDGGSAEL